MNFSECNHIVQVDEFYEACLFDMCDCDKNVAECLCPIISTYAALCVRAGVALEFRRDVDVCSKSLSISNRALCCL